MRSGIGKDVSLPILTTILLKVEKNTISLRATNLEIGVQCSIRGKIEQEGSIALDAKIFSEYVGLLPKEKIDILLTNESILEIHCGSYSTKIRGLQPDDFPLLPSQKKDISLVFSASELRDALRDTLFTIQVQETRPELSGLLFLLKSGEKNLILVGTDAYRLSERKLLLKSPSDGDAHIIIPLKTLQEIARIIPYSVSGEIEMQISENQITFLLDDIELYSRRIQGTYPDYTQIIPQTFTTQCVVESGELVQAIKAASIFSKSGLYDVKLTFTNSGEGKGRVSIYSSNTTIGENTTSLECEIKGEDAELTLNYKYFLDALATFPQQRCIFNLIDSTNPCVLRPLEKDTYRHLIMPIRQ